MGARPDYCTARPVILHHPDLDKPCSLCIEPWPECRGPGGGEERILGKDGMKSQARGRKEEGGQITPPLVSSMAAYCALQPGRLRVKVCYLAACLQPPHVQEVNVLKKISVFRARGQ